MSNNVIHDILNADIKNTLACTCNCTMNSACDSQHVFSICKTWMFLSAGWFWLEMLWN